MEENGRNVMSKEGYKTPQKIRDSRDYCIELDTMEFGLHDIWFQILEHGTEWKDRTN